MNGIESVRLSSSLTRKLKGTIEFTLRTARPKGWVELLVVARYIAAQILRESPELAWALERQRDSRGPVGLLIRGLPVDETTTETPIGDAVSLALASILGVPFQYVPGPDENRLVARLEPKANQQGVKNTGQSDQEFISHCDWSAVAPAKSPKWLLLLALVNDAMATTGITPLDPLLPRVSGNHLPILLGANSIVQLPKNVSTQLQLLSQPRPVLWEDDGIMQVALPTYWIQPAKGVSDLETQAALNEIIALVNEPSATIHFLLGRGDALIFKNHRVLHSRSKVQGRRLVLRTYVASEEAVQLQSLLKPGNLLNVRDLL